ncbi:MAG: hypothetical protein FJ276_05020 [Planctomycetes bacterium]|nr:hypothetical protein [Planctomycetota bacterium]
MATDTSVLSSCECCLSRRRLLAAGCGVCAAWAARGLLPGCSLEAGEGASAAADSTRARVRLIFACFTLKQDRPTWPHIGYDFAPDVERVTSALRKLCPNVEFLVTAAHGPEDAQKLLDAHDADRIDGYIVHQMNNWVRVMQTIVASGKPTIVADFPFSGSGGFLVFTAGLRRQHKNFSVVSSTNVEDLAAAANCFEVVKRGDGVTDFVAACDRVRQQRTAASDPRPCREDTLQLAGIGQCLEAIKGVKLLTVGGAMQNVGKEIEQHLGIGVVPIGFEELSAMCEQADEGKARQLAERWKSAARSVLIDDPDDTLAKSARLYLAQQALLEKHQAEAITINCLGGFYGGHLKAYPCLGFVELLDVGLVGACEADLLSTATMIVIKHLAGRPGFISDPVLDTSKRQIIYAHCVAPTRMLGPASDPNPFEILTHAEDRKGASVRSFLPADYMTTTMEIHPGRREILLHRAKAVENIVIDRACRTKLAGEVVGDVEKLFTYWDQYGWHRVTFYGDLREPMRELAAALKFTFTEEA